LNIGSKETETLVKLLHEFGNGPYSLNALVQELRQKGYCKNQSSAYHYANRILAIRQVFTRIKVENYERTHPTWTGTPEEAKKEVDKMDREGLPILYEINATIDDPRLNIVEKRKRVNLQFHELGKVLTDRLDAIEPHE